MVSQIIDWGTTRTGKGGWDLFSDFVARAALIESKRAILWSHPNLSSYNSGIGFV